MPADVYSDWVDACEDVAQQAAGEEREELEKDRAFSGYATTAGGGRELGGEGDEDEDEDYT